MAVIAMLRQQRLDIALEIVEGGAAGKSRQRHQEEGDKLRGSEHGDLTTQSGLFRIATLGMCK
jgi:hypothetical protein